MLDLARQPVLGPNGARATGDICRSIADDRHVIDGRELALPMRIADFSVMMQVFPVATRGVQRMLARSFEGAEPLRIAQLFPGVSAVVLMAVEYRDNPLGNYRECVIAVPAYAPGERGLTLLGLDMLVDRASQFVYAMPVDQEFTTHAGRFLWGYPKFLAQLEIDIAAREAHARFRHDDQLVFAMTCGVSDSGGLSGKISTLTEREGVVRRIVANVSGKGLSVRPGGALPEIGDTHPLACDLRDLGLPRRPLCTFSLRHTGAEFAVPHAY